MQVYCKVNIEFWHDCLNNLGSTPEEYDKWVIVLEVTQIPMAINYVNMLRKWDHPNIIMSSNVLIKESN